MVVDNMDGIDLLLLCWNDGDVVFYEYENSWGMWMGVWKLVNCGKLIVWELYNLEDDWIE